MDTQVVSKHSKIKLQLHKKSHHKKIGWANHSEKLTAMNIVSSDSEVKSRRSTPINLFFQLFPCGGQSSAISEDIPTRRIPTRR